MVLNFSKCSNSSTSHQDFTMRKPAKKVKIRSILPTHSSLFLGVDESEISKNVPAYKMEEKMRITDGKRIFPDEFSSGSPLFGESKRTEDIFIREDEDGIRSHYCPLISDFNGVRHDNQDCSDSETENEFNTTSSFSLKESYWRQPLVSAVRTPSSESEDSSNDSIKYTPLENQPTTNENFPLSSLNRILQIFQLPERTTTLDKKTMEAWLDDSSDEYDNFFLKDPELPMMRDNLGNESDMEEFEKDSETETENGSLQTTENKNQGDEKDDGNKELLTDTKPSGDETGNESSKESSNKIPQSEHSERKITDENGLSLNLNSTDGDESHEEKLDTKSETNTTAPDLIEEQKKKCVSETDKKSDDSKHNVLDDFSSKSQIEMSTKSKSEKNKIKDPVEINMSDSGKKSQMQAEHSSNDSGKYAPLENQQTTSENSPVSSPNRHLSQLIERTSTLDKATVELWLEDSSDNFDDSFMNNPESPPRDNIGNESDMEEFEKDSETETEENGSLQKTEDKNQGDKKYDGNKELFSDTKPSRNDIKNESSKESSDKLPQSEHSERKSTDENGQSPNLKNTDDDENHEEKLDTKSETNSTARDFNDEPKKECVSEADKKSDDSEHDVLDDFSSKSQIEISTKPKSEENAIKNPVEMNISESKKKTEMQADYGDKLHYETSTETEVTNEKPLRETEFMSYELTLTEIPISKSDNRSNVFEPVLIDEQSVSSKPRNRLAKFFQSFKKKFEKNKKA